MAMADDRPSTPELEPREPTVEDLRDLCRELNQRQARYVVVGGCAVLAAGYNRRTMDVDLVVAVDSDNEARVFSALSTLPDNAVREVQPGELQQYNVIRVADEILVDLMRSAGGIEFEEAAKDVVVLEVQGAHPVCLSSSAVAHEGRHPPREGCRGPGLPAPLVCRAGPGAPPTS